MPRHVKEHPTKRVNQNKDGSKPFSRKFTNIDEIRSSLRSQNQDEVVTALTILRNQLSRRSDEDVLSLQDERLLLAQHWMENVPGAHDIFGIWDGANPRQTSLLALVVAVLSSLLTLLSSHYAFHSLGQPIIKTLLTPLYIRRLNSYVGGAHSELILVTLKLFNGMSSFAGGREKMAVLDSVGWEIKSLPKILNMRRMSKKGDSPDPLAKPDIRTLYLLFILSFIDENSPSSVKTTFIEQHREAFLSIFKGLIQDSYPVARRVLEVCWSGIWSDLKVKRTLKITLFNETTISHILKLYDRTVSEDGNSEHIPADLVHHFLLAICTRPGIGICFKDRGWYPRESEDDGDHNVNDDENESTYRKNGKIYNKILANILKTLKVNEDSRQQELALKIMSACPELVAGYWSGAALTLEPRLSTKWLANISFFGAVISLPVPSSTFHLPNSILYQPAPPPLSAIIENIFPSVNTKAHFSKGLQSSSGLVQHCTAIALAKCLAKFEEVVRVFQEIEDRLGEDEAEGPWRRRRRDIEREARKRVPDFQVVVAFSQQKLGDGQTAPPNPTKQALLSEAAQRLLWMYHQCLPSVVAEARFDVGKVLQNFSLEIVVDAQQDESLGVATKLHMVRQLHVLRLLKESDQFNWSGKMGSSSRSYLAALLKAYAGSDIPAIKTALRDLLQHVLVESIMFQDQPDEPHLWLASLPTSRRDPGTESLDGASLTDEAESVITFLDDCVQRCLKTPYRYIEELYGMGSTTDSYNQLLDVYPSPLLMTVLEQLSIKVEKKSLSPSDTLALATFVRKLVVRLITKLHNWKILLAVAGKIDGMLNRDRLFSDYPIITAAVRREVGLLWACLQPTLDPPTPSGPAPLAIQVFLNQVEQISVPPSKHACVVAAYELIDWLRLIGQALSTTEVRRVSAIVVKFHIPSLLEIGEHLDPTQVSFWDALDLVSRYSELRPYLSFDVLFRHSSERQITDAACRKILADSALMDTPSVVDVKRVVCLIEHRLSCSESRDYLTHGLLTLLASIMERLLSTISPGDVLALKEFIFVRPGIIKTSLMSETLSDLVREGYHQLVKLVLNPQSEDDRMLVSDIGDHWLEMIRASLGSDNSQVPFASVWTKYFRSSDLFGLLDMIGSGTEMTNSSTLDLLEAVLVALQSTISDSQVALIERVPQLLASRPFRDSNALEEVIAAAVEASLPAYCNGQPPNWEKFVEPAIVPFIKQSEVRWSRHLEPLSKNLPIQSFLTQQKWSTSTSKIISGLIYRRALSPDIFFSWLSTDHCAGREIQHFTPVLQAFLETHSSETSELPNPESDVWKHHFSRLTTAVADESLSQGSRMTSGSCIYLLLKLAPTRAEEFAAVVLDQLQKMPVTSLTAEILAVGRRLHATSPSSGKLLVTGLADHGIQWAVRCFAEDPDGSCDDIIEELASVVRIASGIKSHLVETLAGVVARNQLSNVTALELVAALLKVISLKPAVVNRLLQSIIQHPQFFKLSAIHGSAPRGAIVGLLHVLFNLHPANTCQVTHVEPLVQIYRGTLSCADGQLLSIFRLFETHRKASIASLLARWSPSYNQSSSTSLEAIQSLDPIVVLRTCLNFPRWRRLEEPMTEMASAHDAQLYDPLFLMLLFAQTLAENPPSSAFAWVELFRTNIVSLLIKALSSKCGGIREVALCQIAALWQHLEAADLQEKPHVLHILSMLKDVLPSPSEPETPPLRLPSYTTLVLAHALRGVFYPSNFIYPLTARFLLQRPGLDTSDVPMLYNMLYSSSDDWKKERGWIIRFLSDGMMSTEDWRVLKRRHTWDLLASLFQSSETDRPLRKGIFEVLANLTCNPQATTSLILRSGLLSWIEIQLIMTRQVTDGVAWVKILDNIMTVVDPNKIEGSTNGEWRSVICRCLSMLLDDDKTLNTMGILPFVTRAILRLSLLSGPPVSGLISLLNNALECLERMETTVMIPASTTRQLSATLVSCEPLFRACEIHEPYPEREPLQTWGSCVEDLWRATMTMENNHPVWDVLSSRLLLWRAATGLNSSPMGEWARMQVVCNLYNG